ncbi:serine protease [Streptomyces sp. NBC_00102]|uniref:serine protease n=1 Tax=Streptomyces sp. NBC_00102 TaxID=2975652 RepID=UPI002251C55F|nr:serine protease [Streptomyces sp. NBC_00102]MCX5398776.1 NACHT domain-containing protein [Streptomyces sp. NBC_00102]
MNTRPRPVRPTDRTVVVQSARQGSGVLLTDQLVLTCAHVLGGEASASVAHPDLPETVTCRVLWVDAEQDAALLLADGQLPPVPPVRLGVLASAQALPGCEITGFPEIQRYGSERHLEADQYTATVVPMAGLLRNLLACDLDSPPPVTDKDGEALLGGLSGGPVFAGAVLLGLARQIPPRRDGRRVECVSLRPVLESAGFRQAYEQTTGSQPRTEQVHGTYSADLRYEEEYADALGAAYRRTKIFGLDELGRRDSEWDLDTAYLSLEAETGGRWTDRGVRPPVARPTPRRIDDLLTDRPRVLLRGDAGAGKTTLLWWLAAHAVARTLPPRLAALDGLVPFVVPLRTLRARNEPLPAPSGLPGAARLTVDTAPDGWAGRVLESGRGLLLVDGLDEVPPGEREEAYTWLSSLLTRFPETRCVATVRPLAVEPDWLAAEGFEELRLLPLRNEDIQAFVAAWHKAARLDDDDHQRLRELEHDLARQFRTNRTLSDLARTPLLCAVICALHRRQEGFLPNTRWKLYRSSLDMLLGNRDQRRGIGGPEGITMEVEEQALLLQRIAIWLVREGQTEFSREQALRQLDRALASMERVRKQGTTDAILTHLLNRSGLLQERTEDLYQFTHRTFQDYLAAAEFVESDQINELLRCAEDESWADVIELAAGHCGRRAIGELINGLLDRAEKYAPGTLAFDPELAPKTRVLAALCAQHATLLDEGTWGRVRTALAGLYPPRLASTVKLLGSLGPAALTYLPRPSAIRSDVIGNECIAQLLGEVGGPEALSYARDWVAASPGAARLLASRWTRFPTEEFAKDVLGKGDLGGAFLTVRSPAELTALPHLGPLGRWVGVTLGGPFTDADLRRGLSEAAPGNLGHLGNPLLRDLSTLRNGENLRHLTVDGCPGATDLSPLGEWPALQEVNLDVSHLSWDRLAALRDVASLSALELRSPAGRLSDLPPIPHLRHLALLRSGAMELGDLRGWSSLQSLRLPTVASLTSLVAALRTAPSLTEVEVTRPRAEPWPGREEPVTGVVKLSFGVDTGPGTDLRPLPGLFPSLRSLTLTCHTETRIDLTPLHEQPELHVKVVWLAAGGQLLGAEELGDRLSVQSPF